MAKHRASRSSFTRVVAAGLVLGAGCFGILRVTHAEPLPVPAPLSIAEPRPDPNLPTLGSFSIPTVPTTVPTPPALLPPPALPVAPVIAAPTLPVPLPSLPTFEPLPAVPSLPKPVEIAQPTQFKVPTHPIAPLQSVKPENPLQPAPIPLSLIHTELAPPPPLLPETIPVGNEVPVPPRKIGNEILVPPKPVLERASIPMDVRPPSSPPPLPAPGDPTMFSLKKLTLSTGLGVALALAPTTPIRAEEPKPMTAGTTVEESLKTEIRALKVELAKSKVMLDALDEQVMGRKDGKTVVPADAGLMLRMDKLEKAIAAIDTKLAAMDATPSKRTAGSSPTAEGTKPAVGMGMVKVVNLFTTKISITVNDKSYPLDPAQTKEIEVPMGSFSYMLIADEMVKKSSLIKEGETVTLRIR